jgi:hypothetical protein
MRLVTMLACAASLLLAANHVASAKEREFSPVAGVGQEIRFSDGHAVLVTGNAVGNLAVSFLPLDKKSGFVRVWVENASEQQFNVSESSLTASAAGAPLTVFTYADQVKQQKRRAMWAAVATAIAAGANSYSASQAGYTNYSGGYVSHTSVGLYSANTYGRFYGTSYNAGVAYLAQANAAQQNQAMFDRFQGAVAGAAKSLQDRSLKANTLMPGQSVLGDIKLALPKAGADLELLVDVGGQPLALRFHEGAAVVDHTPRAVSAAPATPDLGVAPVQRGMVASGPAADMPTIRLSPTMPIAASPAASGPGLANALAHPSGPAARMELLKLDCTDQFNLVSSVAGKSVFEATCGSGKRQLMECRGAGCRPLN